MKQLILFSTLFGLVACQSHPDVTPVSPAGEVVGTYQTNGFIDYLCLALPTDKMPTVTLQETSENTLTLTLTQRFPQASVQTLTGITLTGLPNQSIYLVRAGQTIGSLETGRIFMANGMESQGKLLRLSISTTSFTGYQP